MIGSPQQLHSALGYGFLVNHLSWPIPAPPHPRFSPSCLALWLPNWLPPTPTPQWPRCLCSTPHPGPGHLHPSWRTPASYGRPNRDWQREGGQGCWRLDLGSPRLWLRGSGLWAQDEGCPFTTRTERSLYVRSKGHSTDQFRGQTTLSRMRSHEKAGWGGSGLEAVVGGGRDRTGVHSTGRPAALKGQRGGLQVPPPGGVP